MEVRLDHVTIRYWKSAPPAVDDLSLTVASGEFMVVVGESGAGKTTLLRLIAGLEKPDSGEIYLDGTYSNDIPVGQRGVQMLFQGLALWPHMKVLDEHEYSNISFPLKVRHFTPAQIAARVRHVASRVRLSPHLFDRRPDELSGGEQQRVALARMLVTDPRAVLMDEPISNLDPLSRAKLRDEIRQLHNESKNTTIFVTHNIPDALALADRIAVMRNGRLIQVAPAEILNRRPADPYVTEFLGAS